MMMMEQVLEIGSMTSSKLALSILYCPAIMVPKTVTSDSAKTRGQSRDIWLRCPTKGGFGAWFMRIYNGHNTVNFMIMYGENMGI